MTSLHLTFFLLVLLNVFGILCAWKIDRKPRIFGDDVSDKIISTKFRRVQKRIVFLHDFFRSKVSPPASNMLNMRWHSGAACVAQKWADQCHFLQHDPAQSRVVGNFGACGQNIFVSTHKVPWLFAIKNWFIERQNFTYGSNQNDLSVIGHYTQMVWAATHRIGCGLTKCNHGGPGGRPFYNYVCDYCPIGNYQKTLGFPYKAGSPCGSCPRDCLAKKGLCTNSCNAADLWDNCQQLNGTWSQWLCNTFTEEGLDRRKNCLATCNCPGKIYD